MSLLPKLGTAPLLCYVTDRHSLPAVDPNDAREVLLQKVAAAAVAGVDWIQLREKDLSGKEASSLACEAVRLATKPVYDRASRILINDRLDVALAARAGGVHLGEQSLSSQEAHRLVQSQRREDFLIGFSCHSLDAAKNAERSGADYLFFGPVFATPSKAAYGAPQGLDRLAEVCRSVKLPVLAIGGLTQENAASCLSAGASGIAAIRLFQDAPDLPALVPALKKSS